MAHKSGDVRADGYIFSQYSRAKNGKLYELWLSPEARAKDLERRRVRIEKKRRDSAFLTAERARKNAARRERYAADFEYRKKAIQEAIKTEQRLTNDSEWRVARNKAKRNRVAERYRIDDKFRAAMCEKAAGRRVKIDSFLDSADAPTREVIRAIYTARRRVSECTGILHHVDHIIPVARGGSHSPSNLRVITARMNQRKHAKLIP